MTVNELLKRMSGAYAAFDNKAIEAFGPAFRARFQRHEGAALEDAANAVLGSWRPHAGQRFPLPADFDEHLPVSRLNLPSEGPKLDFQARNKRAVDLMAEWRRDQLARASNGVPQLVKALEEEAQPIALMMGFEANPKPLQLTRKQVRIAQQRAISLERLLRHGKPEMHTAAAWWEQVTEIGRQWGIEVTEEWWPETKTRRSQEAA